MSGKGTLAAKVKEASDGSLSQPDPLRKQAVGDALRNDPSASKDLWSVFQPHLSAQDDNERWLALDCLHDCLRSVMPALPAGDIKNMESTATKIRDGNSSGRDKEAAYAILGDTGLWDELRKKQTAGGPMGGKHGDSGRPEHGMPGGAMGSGPSKHEGGAGGVGGPMGGKHGDGDEPGLGGKHGGDDKHGKKDDDDKHGLGGLGSKHSDEGKHGKDDDDKHGKKKDDDKKGKLGKLGDKLTGKEDDDKHGKDDDRKHGKDDDDKKGTLGKLTDKLTGKDDDKHGKGDDDKHGRHGADAKVHVSGTGGDKHGGRRHEEEAGGHGGRHGDRH